MTFSGGDVGREIVAQTQAGEIRARVVSVRGEMVSMLVHRRLTDSPSRGDEIVTVRQDKVSSWAAAVPGGDIAWAVPGGLARGALRDVKGGRGRF